LGKKGGSNSITILLTSQS